MVHLSRFDIDRAKPTTTINDNHSSERQPWSLNQRQSSRQTGQDDCRYTGLPAWRCPLIYHV